jgi:signal transduction histidine kinase
MLGGFFVMSALLIILCIFAILYTNRMQNNTRRILEENVTSLKAAEELEIALLDMKGYTSYYLHDGDLTWLDMFRNKKEVFIQWMEEAEDKTYTHDEQLLIDDMIRLFDRYLDFQEEVVKWYQDGNTEAAVAVLKGEMRRTFDRIYQKCEDVLLINEKLILDSKIQIERDNRKLNTVMYSIGVTGILLGIGLGIFLARTITLPIYQLVLKVRGVTSGEIIEKVDIDRKTEFEDLNQHIGGLIEKFHKMNDEYQKSQQLLISAERQAALGKIAAGFAHEVRNPLTAIKMLVYSLYKEINMTPAMEGDFQVMFKEIDRMEKYIQNFLDFARPPNPNYSTINIHDAVTYIINLLHPQIKNKHIKLKISQKVENPIVFADREQIQQVFMNIILNALQSMASYGTLEIITQIHYDTHTDKKYIQIVIKDTGHGISEELLPYIFDPMVTSREDGTGLGLPIAQQIVNNHHGWIQAMNNHDKGAIFLISLPMK